MRFPLRSSHELFSGVIAGQGKSCRRTGQIWNREKYHPWFPVHWNVGRGDHVGPRFQQGFLRLVGWRTRRFVAALQIMGRFDTAIPTQRNRWFADSLLEEAVLSELVSEAKFPASWENTGNFVRLGLRVRLL